MKIYISHSSGYDFNSNLYNPLKNSSLSTDNEIFFPHDDTVINTKKMIGSLDLVIAEVSYPTTGQGIELGWADMFNVPILCIYKKGSKISSSLKFITNNFLEYTDNFDMINKLVTYLTKN